MTGSCLCGRVRYQVEGELTAMHHCHCSMCRKHSGAAFATLGAAPVERFRWTRGEEELRDYQGPHVRRTFCGTCGSSLVESDDRSLGYIWVAAGSLDDDPAARPLFHIFVDSKAPWFTITDDLTQFATAAEQAG